jgi:hypothetical protein
MSPHRLERPAPSLGIEGASSLPLSEVAKALDQMGPGWRPLGRGPRSWCRTLGIQSGWSPPSPAACTWVGTVSSWAACSAEEESGRIGP